MKAELYRVEIMKYDSIINPYYGILEFSCQDLFLQINVNDIDLMQCDLNA